MKYTKTFKDTETGVKYYVTECYLKSSGELRLLILLSLESDTVVEVSIDHEGTAIKLVSHVYGSLMGISVDQFNERFIEVN